MNHVSPRRAQKALPPSLRRQQTHKLPPQRCALWLPDRRAYLLRVDPSKAVFETTVSPAEAWQLNEEEAEAVGLVFHDLTGLRVALRPFYSQAS